MLGMSNKVMGIVVTDPALIGEGISPSKAILRIYPEKNNRTTNRKREQAVFEYLSKVGKGVKMLYSCPKYRIEEFFDGGKLIVEELHDRKLMKKIAKVLCDYNRDEELLDLLAHFDTKTPFAQVVIDEWQPLFREEFETYVSNVRTEEALNLLKKIKYMTTPEFEKEYRKLLKGLSKSEVVASHCDIHEMNMMRSADHKKLMLIDYEYASPNYRAIDVATLFMETTIDYTYPVFPYVKQDEKMKWNEEELLYFVGCYLEREAKHKNVSDVKKYVKAETSTLVYEIRKAEPLICAMWSLWSVLLINWDTFDETKDWNLEYAAMRFDMYENYKESALKL
jgi:thiamine kinase-like enzyme